MTPDELSQLRTTAEAFRAAQQATPNAPWEAIQKADHWRIDNADVFCIAEIEGFVDDEHAEKKAKFVVHPRNTTLADGTLALIDEVERLRAKLSTTKDGTFVGLGDFVWAKTGNRYVVADKTFAQYDINWGKGKNRRKIGDQDYLHIGECYSSLDAALKGAAP